MLNLMQASERGELTSFDRCSLMKNAGKRKLAATLYECSS